MKISVCMATYNGGKYLREQIDSILPQLSTEDELIVSDDSSTDNTMQILESYDDPRIRILRFQRDKSAASSVTFATTNFENALKHATGDIIFLSDQDDVWLPNKVSKMTQLLGAYDYVVSDCYITDARLQLQSSSRFTNGLTKNRWKALIAPTPWQGSCAAFKRNVLEKALPFPKGLQSHDRWIGYIGSIFFRSHIMEEPLIYYRRHECSTSTATSGKSNNTTIDKIKIRLHYLSNLFKRYFRR